MAAEQAAAAVRGERAKHKVGQLKTNEFVEIDKQGKPIYRLDRGGPATITGWLNDLSEKAFNPYQRFYWQGRAGYSAPTPLVVFGTPETAFQPLLAKEKYIPAEMKGNDRYADMEAVTMLEAIRTGKATVGQVFAQMAENTRGFEVLRLFRAVQEFNTLPAIPIGRLDMVINEKAADDKFMQETIKIFYNS